LAVTEQQWLLATDPMMMLEFVRGQATERQLRLFACACCRQSWHLFRDGDGRRAIDIAERFADGGLTPRQLESARKTLPRGDLARYALDPGAGRAAEQTLSELASPAVSAAVHPEGWHSAGSAEVQTVEKAIWDAAWRHLRQRQAALLRDIIPYRPMPLDPEALLWNNGWAVRLAREIYASRSFSRLPVLADVLEAAGCMRGELLDHCREQGEHVRGCFVVDLVMGKGKA
jgi:hypothetical protein